MAAAAVASDLKVDVETFCTLLARSFGTDANTKQRVVDSAKTLSQFQIDGLTKVFSEEADKLLEKLGDGYLLLAEHYEQGDIIGQGDNEGELAA